MMTGELGCSSAAFFFQSSLSTPICSCRLLNPAVSFAHAASHASRYGPNKTLVAFVTGPWFSRGSQCLGKTC